MSLLAQCCCHHPSAPAGGKAKQMGTAKQHSFLRSFLQGFCGGLTAGVSAASGEAVVVQHPLRSTAKVSLLMTQPRFLSPPAHKAFSTRASHHRNYHLNPISSKTSTHGAAAARLSQASHLHTHRVVAPGGKLADIKSSPISPRDRNSDPF